MRLPHKELYQVSITFAFNQEPVAQQRLLKSLVRILVFFGKHVILVPRAEVTMHPIGGDGEADDIASLRLHLFVL